jgi:ribonuclease Z
MLPWPEGIAVLAKRYVMRPLFHPSLVNGRFGDPALFVDTLFERHAILFDLGDITALTPREIRRVDRIFVSHAHIDHFFGFDRLLRILVGRESQIHLYGPEAFIDRVRHKLHAYHWNLVDRYLNDLVFVVTEIDAARRARVVRFRLKNAFLTEEIGCRQASDGIVHNEPMFQISAVVLDHRTPCLGFALEERAHVNVWKNRLEELRLPVGPWLRELKRAVIENRPDDYAISIGSRTPSASSESRVMQLGDLRQVVTVTPGQRIGYVTDVADTPANRKKIIQLMLGVDVLFIEAAFAEADAMLASERGHLTTKAAGEIARAAGVRRVEPFHFSSRYEGAGDRLLTEVSRSFRSAEIAGP